MIFCTNCGQQLEDFHTFCTACGFPVKSPLEAFEGSENQLVSGIGNMSTTVSDNIVQLENNEQNETKELVEALQKKEKQNKLWQLLLLFALLLAVASIMFLFVDRQTTKKNIVTTSYNVNSSFTKSRWYGQLNAKPIYLQVDSITNLMVYGSLKMNGENLLFKGPVTENTLDTAKASFVTIANLSHTATSNADLIKLEFLIPSHKAGHANGVLVSNNNLVQVLKLTNDSMAFAHTTQPLENNAIPKNEKAADSSKAYEIYTFTSQANLDYVNFDSLKSMNDYLFALTNPIVAMQQKEMLKRLFIQRFVHNTNARVIDLAENGDQVFGVNVVQFLNTLPKQTNNYRVVDLSESETGVNCLYIRRF